MLSLLCAELQEGRGEGGLPPLTLWPEQPPVSQPKGQDTEAQLHACPDLPALGVEPSHAECSHSKGQLPLSEEQGWKRGIWHS